jgi:hypothetical protein
VGQIEVIEEPADELAELGIGDHDQDGARRCGWFGRQRIELFRHDLPVFGRCFNVSSGKDVPSMSQAVIENPIINSPFDEPTRAGALVIFDRAPPTSPGSSN